MKILIAFLLSFFIFLSCSEESSNVCRNHGDCLPNQICHSGFCKKFEGVCIPGTSQNCYSGPKETKGKGLCRGGIQLCDSQGAWSTECQGERTPFAEICDGLDNNCDGYEDNFLASLQEECDGIDNDCDGKVDNIDASGSPLLKDCYSGDASTLQKEPCQGGKQRCILGKWEDRCIGEIIPKNEICRNNIDEDCDGSVDNIEQIGKACDDPELPNGCRTGTYACDENNGEIYCKPLQARDEECNEKDDDCDGKIDNIRKTTSPIERDCVYNGPTGTYNVGTCRAPREKCVDGKWNNICLGEKRPLPEKCNGEDDDCDGKTDNLVGSSNPLTQSCYSGPDSSRHKGECSDGMNTCIDGKWDAVCVGEITPKEEKCNTNKDENCDEAKDNVRLLGNKCLDDGRRGKCREGILVCQGQQRVCRQTSFAENETCNGVDDDCDGLIDNVKGSSNPITRSCYTGPAQTSRYGSCKSGLQRCISGKWSETCFGEVLPREEMCNREDDDCDDKIDEDGVCGACGGGSRDCYSGPIATKGRAPCKSGKEICEQGKWPGVCVGDVKPTPEDCNGVDDDCDGWIDNFDHTQNPLREICTDGKNVQTLKGTCRYGVKRCVQGSWGSCLWEQLPATEICDNKDNDCDGAVDEDSLCIQSHQRDTGELCSNDVSASTNQKCKLGLVCLQAHANDFRAFCYKPCGNDSQCRGESEGRRSCVTVSSNTKVCSRLNGLGAYCENESGFLCQPNLVCDAHLKKCREPNEVKEFHACGGNTGAGCEPTHFCARINPERSHGYCLKRCTKASDCPSNVCMRTFTGISICTPLGTQGVDELCSGNDADKIDISLYCAKDMVCSRPYLSSPKGTCLRFHAGEKCPFSCGSGRVCVGYGSGAGVICAKDCRTLSCPKDQDCRKLGNNTKICLQKSPTGPIQFGGLCNTTIPGLRCVLGMSCLTESSISPQGHCSTLGCTSDADCPSVPRGGKCLPIYGADRSLACVFPCQASSDCPVGLVCRSTPTQKRCVAP